MFSLNLIFYGNPLIAGEWYRGFFAGSVSVHCLYYLVGLLPEDKAREQIEYAYKFTLEYKGASNETKNYVKNFRFSSDHEKCNSLLP